MKFIKVILIFAALYVASPTGYSITLTKLEQDSTKQKNKISNQKAFDMFELVEGITSFVGGIAIFGLGTKLIRTDLSLTMAFGKFFIILGVIGFIVGVLLLIHFFIRQRKKKKDK